MCPNWLYSRHTCPTGVVVNWRSAQGQQQLSRPMHLSGEQLMKLLPGSRGVQLGGYIWRRFKVSWIQSDINCPMVISHMLCLSMLTHVTLIKHYNKFANLPDWKRRQTGRSRLQGWRSSCASHTPKCSQQSPACTKMRSLYWWSKSQAELIHEPFIQPELGRPHWRSRCVCVCQTFAVGCILPIAFLSLVSSTSLCACIIHTQSRDSMSPCLIRYIFIYFTYLVAFLVVWIKRFIYSSFASSKVRGGVLLFMFSSCQECVPHQLGQLDSHVFLNYCIVFSPKTSLSLSLQMRPWLFHWPSTHRKLRFTGIW